MACAHTMEAILIPPPTTSLGPSNFTGSCSVLWTPPQFKTVRHNKITRGGDQKEVNTVMGGGVEIKEMWLRRTACSRNNTKEPPGTEPGRGLKRDF